MRCRALPVVLVALLLRCCLSAASSPELLRYGPKHVATSGQLLNCSVPIPRSFDDRGTLQKLYGKHFRATSRGEGNIFVLGHHNSGTSMLTRLIMLMGAFQGNLAGLSTSPTNRLKYWEKHDVSHFHDMLLTRVADPAFKPYHAQSINMSKISSQLQRSFSCFINRIYRDLNRSTPWVIKDPRMLLFAEQWVHRAKAPVCVINFRDPLDNSISLAANEKKSAATSEKSTMTVTRWLSAWEQGMLSALRACREQPTVLVHMEDVKGNFERALYGLYSSLARANVTMLQLPTRAEIEREFGNHMKGEHRERSRSPDGTLSHSQDVLYKALQFVAVTPAVSESANNKLAAIVLDMYEDMMRVSPDMMAAPRTSFW